MPITMGSCRRISKIGTTFVKGKNDFFENILSLLRNKQKNAIEYSFVFNGNIHVILNTLHTYSKRKENGYEIVFTC